MKRLQKRLALNRDTIRELTAEDLAFVGGGTGEDDGENCRPVEVQQHGDDDSGNELCRYGGGGGGGTIGGGGGGGTIGGGTFSNQESNIYVGTLCQIQC